MKKREQLNPGMSMVKTKAKGEPISDERTSPKMPQVGNMPSGKNAAKKVEIGQG